MTSAPNVTQAVPFFWVRDIEASIRSTRDGLGFVLTNAWIDDGNQHWCWLELGGAAVDAAGVLDGQGTPQSFPTAPSAWESPSTSPARTRSRSTTS